MAKRKRKNDEEAIFPAWSLMVVLGVGVLLLVVVSAAAVVTWIGKLAPTPVVVIPTLLPPTALPTPIPPTSTPPPQAHFVISTDTGEILSNPASWTFTPTGAHGNAVTSGNYALAYVRDEQLYFYSDSHESAINLPGSADFPVWDSKSLWVVVGKNSVYRVDGDGTSTNIVTFASSIIAPPRRFSQNKLLITISQGPSQTVLYTYDLDANVKEAISQVIPFDVTGLDYSPAKNMIAFSEANGGLYLLPVKTDTGDQNLQNVDAEQILADSVPKSDPSFSPDGEWLAYLGANRLYVANLNDIANNLNQPFQVGNLTTIVHSDWMK